jgi:hypothetical protein
LTGFVPGGKGLPQDAIIVARAMGAAELLDYPRAAIRGLVLEDGADQPCGDRCPRHGHSGGGPGDRGIASLAENRDSIIVDGEDGIVHLRPMADVQNAYADKVRFRAKRQEQYQALRTVEPRTRDGQYVTLQMNAGLLVDLPQLSESGASGIGLFRTELQFMIASTMPKVDEQETSLPQCAAAGGRQAGHLPDARYRRRQGGALFPLRRRGESGAGLARHPAVAGPAGIAAHPASGVAEGRGRRRAQADAADGHRGQRASPGARIAEQGSPASLALRPSAAAQACSSAPCWKCQACCGSSTS